MRFLQSQVRILCLALGLLNPAACTSIVEVGQRTAGSSNGATTVGARTTGGATSGGGAGSGGTTTGAAAIGEPVISAAEGGSPNPCEVDIDFGFVLIGQAASVDVTVDNVGNAVLSLSQVVPTLDPAFGLTYPNPAPIQPDGSDQFSVSFTPYKVGTVTSVFSIQTNGLNPRCSPTATGDSLTVKLTGNGVEESLIVTPNTLDFGNTLINTTARQSVTLTNESAMQITGIVANVTGADASLFTVINAPGSLSAGSSATVDISYAPLSLETRSLASVTFSGSDDQSATLSLFGEPVGLALTLSPNPISCGFVPINTTAVCCTTVTDQANVQVTISGVQEFATAGGAFGLATPDGGPPSSAFALPVTIQPGASAEVCFSFTPSVGQQYISQATLTTDDPSGENPIVELSGWGGGPQIQCSPTSVGFGQVTDFNAKTVSVLCTNTGTALPGITLTLGPLDAGPSVFSAAFDPTMDPYPAAGLDPGTTAQIDVTYTPVTASTDLGTLIIPNNGGQGSTLYIPLSGSGQP